VDAAAVETKIESLLQIGPDGEFQLRGDLEDALATVQAKFEELLKTLDEHHPSKYLDQIDTALQKIAVKIQALAPQLTLEPVQQAIDQVKAALGSFDLEKEPAAPVKPLAHHTAATDAAAVAERLQRISMEGLTIDDISLDPSQARVSISGVPNTPGIAAKVFEEIAAAGIFVDMIVQSHPSTGGSAVLSFTVPQKQLTQSVAAAQKIAKLLHCKAVTSSPIIAKLSVSGVGLRTHTGVAIRMFKALSEAGINLDLINLGKALQTVVNLGEIDRENIHSLPQTGHFQDLIALESAICLDVDRRQAILGIIKEKAAQARANAIVKPGANRDHECDLGEHDKNLAIAITRRPARPDIDVKQMLLATLARGREPAVAQLDSGLVCLRSHFLGGPRPGKVR